MSKKTKIKAFLNAECPKCLRGAIFSGLMYQLKFQKMNSHCPHCAIKFEIEPGYFYAAMYVSYAMNVLEGIGISFLAYAITHQLDFDDVWLYILSIIGGCVLLAPFNFRYSRVILLHCLSPKLSHHSYPEDSPAD